VSSVEDNLRELLSYAKDEGERSFALSQLDRGALQLSERELGRIAGVDVASIERHALDETVFHARIERQLARAAADQRTYDFLLRSWKRRFAWKEELSAPQGGEVKLSLRAKHRLVTLRVPDSLESFLIVFEVFVREIYRPFAQAEPVDTIYDLGAHVGIAALYLFGVHPGGRLVCVEPLAENIELLRDNLERNRVPATVIEGAVASRAGTAIIHACPEARGLSAAVPVRDLTDRPLGHLSSAPREVRTIAFDQLLEGRGYGIKIDVEGAEHGLLGHPELLDRAAWLVGELHLGPRIVAQTQARAFESMLRRSFDDVDLGPPGVFGDTLTYAMRACRRVER
jgi:FkbM family methyltransferase